MAVSDEIKEQTQKLKDMTFKEKAEYIWDYYKIFIIVGIFLIVGSIVLIRDVRENQKPTHLYAAFINSNLAYDPTITLEEDYIRCAGIDTEKEHLYLSYDITFSPTGFDTTALAFQQKLVGLYQAGDLDVVIGPVYIMETAADSDGYGDLSEMLPQELLDDLEERGYEFYYYSGHRYTDEELSYMDADDLEYIKNHPTYLAGIYLDNCSYLNNMGEYGAYDPAETEDDRVIFTIPVSTKRLDKSIEFLKFITE